VRLPFLQTLVEILPRRSFLQIASLSLTVASALFLAKGNLVLSVEQIVQLSVTKWTCNPDVLNSLSGQRADTWVGVVFLVLAFVLQMWNVSFPPTRTFCPQQGAAGVCHCAAQGNAWGQPTRLMGDVSGGLACSHGLRLLPPWPAPSTFGPGGEMRVARFAIILALCSACGNARTTDDAPGNCTALAPAESPMKQWVHDQFFGYCGSAAADANGNLAFQTTKLVYDDGWGEYLDFFDTSGNPLGTRDMGGGRSSTILIQQPSGFAGVETTYFGARLIVHAWDSAGVPLGGSESLSVQAPPIASRFAPDPRGGVLLFGLLESSLSPPASRIPSVVLFATTASPVVRWGPRPVDPRGAFLGAGVDVQGRSLVITDGGARFGSGHVSAQWFDQTGSALTGEFDLFPGPFGHDDWFEGWPLIEGGLLIVRRTFSAADTTQKIAVLRAGETRAAAVPTWMSSRANSRLQIAYGGRAYAVMPLGAKDVPCTQRLEIVAADGTVCSARDYAIATGTCTTKDLALGADGTVIQPLPDELETKVDNGVVTEHTCTWRWWPRALR
jgi:hypothetical protein